MKLHYCKPETEVDLLVLEEFILYGMKKPEIETDMEDPDDITW